MKKRSQHGMCKRNSPDKNEAGMGCGRETPQIKKEKRNQHGVCKTNSQQKDKASMGCVRETPQLKIKPAWVM